MVTSIGMRVELTHARLELTCAPRVGMSVELSREAYTEHPAFLALCGDGPGVIIGVQLAANSPEFVRPLDPHFPDKFHSLQVAFFF